jgi:uncharacterized protein YqeY
MSLEEIINEDLKKAMLARDHEKLNALRAVKAAILLLKTEKNAGEITPEIEMKLLQRLVKQRKESAEIYKTQNREDLYAEEIAQMKVLEAYLPAQLSHEEIEKTVKQIMEEHEVSSIKDMGKLMGLTTKALAGKADNKVISEIVRSLLA